MLKFGWLQRDIGFSHGVTPAEAAAARHLENRLIRLSSLLLNYGRALHVSL
jgi:hypothetical protein